MKTSHLIIGFSVCLLINVIGSVTALAAPQKVFALSHQNFSGGAGSPSDTIQFYDVSAIESGGASNVFGNSPMFSVWLGYEIFQGQLLDNPTGVPIGNQEDISAITFNPANGTIYAAAFDSALGAPGNLDEVGDATGDWDLFRIDYQEILDDFVTNSRPAGTIYAPRAQNIPIADETFLQSNGSNLFDGTIDGLANNIPHPEGSGSFNGTFVEPTTIHLDNAIQKVGELARTQSPVTFFDSEIDFITPDSIAFLESASNLTTVGDFQIREWKRVSASPGAATLDADGPDNMTGPPGFAINDDDQQGGRNGAATESWEATIAGRLELDSSGGVESNPAGWALVNHNGTLGVWVADADGGGDDIAFFELDFTGPTPTATRKELFTSPGAGPHPTAFALDEDPSTDTTTNDAEVDFLRVDKDGNLIIGESGFFDTIIGQTTAPTGANGETAQEPRVITVGIADYDGADSDGSGGNEVVPSGPAGTGFNDTAAYTVTGDVPVTGAIDNDTQVTNSSRVAYDKGTGYIYFIDQDGGPNFLEDIYVFDPATGTIIYSELEAMNPGIFNPGTQVIFTRGDINGDGVVDGSDITELTGAIAAPTALLDEWYDLTADGVINNDDLTELQSIIGTTPGDFDGDGDVDGADFLVWQRTDGSVSGLSDWQGNYGFGSLAASAASNVAVPEPSSLLLCLGMGLILFSHRKN